MTNRAKLPGLPRVSTQDKALNSWITAVAERLEVREGSRGDPGERSVTVKELQALTRNAVKVVGGELVASGALAGSTDPTTDPNFVARLEEAIRNTRLYQNLLKRLDDPGRFDDLAAEVRQALASSIAQEALSRGTDIRRLETKIQTSDRSLAMAVEELTAAIGTSAAGIREVKSAFATADRAQAAKVSQLEASLGSYYQDGTEGRASLEETLTATVDKVDGISAEYMVKVAVGADGNKKVAGFGLSATEDPEGNQDSAFIVLADKFAVVTPNDTIADPNNPPPERIPFGVDANGVFINGSLRVNSGAGAATLDNVVSRTYADYIFKRSTTALTTAPTQPVVNGVTDLKAIPSGWSDAPPPGTDTLYMSKGTRKADGDLVGAWSLPVSMEGKSGKEGKYTEYQYAVGATAPAADATTWGASPTTPGAGQFLWMRSRVVDPATAPPAWGSAVRISGEKGGPGDVGPPSTVPGPRGPALATIPSSTTVSDASFNMAFMEKTGLIPITGDQVLRAAIIYTRGASGSWANTTVFQVDGDAVIAGTLVANTVSTDKVIIKPIGSRSGALTVTNGVGFIAFNTSSVVTTPLWSYAVDPPPGVHVSVLWYYNTDTTVWFQVHASNFSGGPYSGTIGTVKVWMF